MAEYKQIKIRIWQDNWFLSLNTEEKLLWLFLLTNQNCHISGLYELASPLVAPLTGIKNWEKILLKFAKNEKIYYLDGWVYIKNYNKHQPISEKAKDNANKSIKKHLEENKLILDKMERGKKPLASPLPDPSGKGRGIGIRIGSTTKVVEETFGNENINSIINFLKEKLQTSLDGTIKENRRYANLLIKKFEKDFPDSPVVPTIYRLIEIGLGDKFHGKNITNFKYLYYNAIKIIKTKENNKSKLGVI